MEQQNPKLPKVSCNACSHARVCRYIESVRILETIGTLEFQCKMNDASGALQEEPEAKDLYPELSVDELSRRVRGDEQQPSKTETQKSSAHGECSICHRKDTVVYTCEHCDRLVCGDCCDIVDSLSPNLDTGDYTSIEELVCTECQESEEQEEGDAV